MNKKLLNHFKLKPLVTAFCATAFTGMAVVQTAQADDAPGKMLHTRSPIKHVILLIGENRSFDNIYGTYVPRRGQTVSNLLSKGIVNADGTPGPQASLAAQMMLNSVPGSFFVNQPVSNKTPYSVLPAPNTSYVPAIGVTYDELANAPTSASAPFDPSSFATNLLEQVSPALSVDDLFLLTTGGTDLEVCNLSATKTVPDYPPQGCFETDTRYENYDNLANTVYPIFGPNLPYDSYTGDQVHRFFQMWQQSDCDVSNATATNPSGCLNDLYPYVGVARNDGSAGNSMGFYNMQHGDAPFLKYLADHYTLSDNYHQGLMGGTFVQHMMLGTADAMPWQAYTNQQGVTISQPPANVIANPTPNGGAVVFTADKSWTSCDADWTQTILDYEGTLPWKPNNAKTACTSGLYYQINNTSPGYMANGEINDAGITSGSLTPPSSVPTIGDALNAKNITWAYYGGGYDAAVRVANGGDTNPIDLMIGSNGAYYCDICNPFGYAKSIMGNPEQREAHIKDATDFFTDLANGQLPAVAYVKPDSFTDGHPASSKLDLFEALAKRMYQALLSQPKLFEETLFLITFDEGGGYWDSGFIQPVDFFGDGPRIPLLAISPHTAGGKVDHTYADHASIVKFIERNWGLSPLSERSRDNLPNPVQNDSNPYVPANMPAIGDLFNLLTHGKS